MGLLDAFKGNEYKREVERLQGELSAAQRRLSEAERLLTPEMSDSVRLSRLLEDLNGEFYD